MVSSNDIYRPHNPLYYEIPRQQLLEHTINNLETEIQKPKIQTSSMRQQNNTMQGVTSVYGGIEERELLPSNKE